MARKKIHNEDQESKTRILIVDDHPIVRQGLTQLINCDEDFVVCGQAQNAPEAMSIIGRTKPDIVIVDISLKDRSGLELIKDIKDQYPALAVLALSMHDESLYAERALRAGAKGYVMKDEATENVVKAIRQILNGRIYVSDKMAVRMMHKLVGQKSDMRESPVECLSDRELQVFTMLGKGTGTRQIAQKLSLSVKTIETYRAHIKEKLYLTDAAELLTYAIQWANSQNNK